MDDGYQARYYSENREKILARKRAKYASNPEKFRSRKVSYRENKPSQYKAARDRYYLKNRRRIRARVKASIKENGWITCLAGCRRRALKRGINYSLSPAWARSVWTGKCSVTGLDFLKPGHGFVGGHMLSASIDRIDQNLGYTPDNCRFVCFGFNAMRGSNGDAEALSLARAIVEGLSRIMDVSPGE